MGLVTEHRAECDRCGATTITSAPDLPTGWRKVAHPTQVKTDRVLCGNCVRALGDFLERLPEVRGA